MLLLGIDTATEVAAVGIAQNGNILSDVSERSRTGHAAHLPDLVTRALRAAGTTLDRLDAIAVSIGPGSFTGLRVSSSFAKGVAFSTGIRLVAVPTLEALAFLAPQGARTIAVIIDARRGETYASVFRRAEGGLERVVPDVSLAPEDACARIVPELDARSVVLGDATERYPEAFTEISASGASWIPFDEIHPRGSAVALVGERRLELGESESAEVLAPVYVRSSAAERMKAERADAAR